MESEYRKKCTVCTKKKSRWPNCSSGLPSHRRGWYSPKQWMNYQTNLTYTYNLSTTLGEGGGYKGTRKKLYPIVLRGTFYTDDIEYGGMGERQGNYSV